MSHGAGQSLSPRPVWQILLVGVLLLGWLAAALAYRAMRSGRAAMPIRIAVELEDPAAAAELRLVHVFYSGYQDPPIPGDVEGNARVWRVEEKWARSLLLAGKPSVLDDIDGLTIHMDDESWSFPRDTWRSECPAWEEGLREALPAGWEVRRISAAIPRSRSILPPCRRLLNYPGDLGLAARALRQISGHPAFFLVLGCLAAALAARFWMATTLRHETVANALLPTCPAGGKPCDFEASDAPPGSPTRRWFLAGLLIVATCGVFLEIRQPYYFSQDDNFSQFLPGMLQGCRAVFSGGSPAWNPYQYLGAPLAEVGTYALTYPFTYVSYAVARYGLGNEMATLEVFCWLHLVAGFAAYVWFGRQLGITAPLATAMGLCLTLSGYALMGGRSWFYMTPTFVWAPLLGTAAVSLAAHPPGWRWVLGTGAVIGLFFHAGNAQMWSYSMGFFCLALLIGRMAGRLPWRRLVHAAAALLIGLGLAAPLAVAQFLATRELARIGGGGDGIWSGLHALLLPYPLGKASHPCGWGNTDLAYMGQVYYAGSVLTLAWLAGLIAIWAFRGGSRRLLRNPLSVLAILALVLSLGTPGVLWMLQARLPVFDQFKLPIKFVPFIHFFSLAAGALVIDRLVRRSSAPARWRRVCFAAVVVLIGYHVILARPCFHCYGDRPYPALPAELESLLRDGPGPVRILPLAPTRSVAPGYTSSLEHNFATVYRVHSFSGYDPLVSERPQWLGVMDDFETDPVTTIRRHGVTHLLVHRLLHAPVLSGNPFFVPAETSSPFFGEPLRNYCDRTEPVVEMEDIRLIEVDNADPLAFAANDPSRPLRIDETPGGLAVDVSAMTEGGPVVVNYLWYRGICVAADDRPIRCAPDEFGRIRVPSPPGTQTLTVRYESPWALGIGIGACLLVLGAAVHFLQARCSSAQGSEPPATRNKAP